MVIVFCLPPNTTHITQPSDKGVFGPLKNSWMHECQKFMSKNPCKVVNQYNFMEIFSKAWYGAMTIPNVLSAFHTTGVFPFNRHAIKLCDPILPSFASLAQSAGIAYNYSVI